MIGSIRFILASLVVLNHLWLPTANKVGAHAVIAFYIISGFLMSKVIREVYGPSIVGGIRFIANRFLRIFPPYLFFLSTSLMLLHIFPDTFGQTYSNMQFPKTAASWLANVTLIDLPHSQEIVIPPAWTLSIEIFFYIMMILIAARNRLTVTTWFLASLIITGWLIVTGANFSSRYSPIYAASLFFSMGSMVYFFIDRLSWLKINLRVVLALIPLFCFFPLIIEILGLDRTMEGYYGATLLFLPIFITFLTLDKYRWNLIDRLLGDLAYPVFITHFLAAGIVRIIFPNLVAPYGFVFLLLSYILCIGISIGFLRINVKWFDPIRNRIRYKQLPMDSSSFTTQLIR